MFANLFPRVIQPLQKQVPVSGQCDCACGGEHQSYFPDPDIQILTPVTCNSDQPWSSHPELQFIPLTASNDFAVAFVPSGQGIVLVNTPVRELLAELQKSCPLSRCRTLCYRQWEKSLGDSILNTLLSLGFLTDGSEVLVKDVPVSLIAWLHLTDRCNLRCAHCYLPHICADMSSATGHAAIDATFRSATRNGYRTVKLKYAGGEPLLQFPLIMELHSYAQSLAHRYDLELDGVVLSNGTLLTAGTVETMRTLGLRLMISLDGIGVYHDCQRHYPDGRGSFTDTAHAIDLALAGGLAPDISITVSGRSAEGLPELMAWVLERDLPFSLNFYRENDNSANLRGLRLEEESIIAEVLAAYKVVEANLPRRSLLASLGDRANLAIPHRRPCSVGQNYVVFDTEGQVSKCQMQMDKLITDASVVDPLTLIRTAEDGIQNLAVDEKEECRECKWRYWCAGGCPLQAYRATDRYDAKSPNCNIYRELFPEIVRLEGLRLLKYAADVR